MTDSHAHEVVEHEGRGGEGAHPDERLAGRIGEHVRRALQDILKSPEALRQAIHLGPHEHALSRRVANGHDPAAVAALLAAGGVGFGVAWLIFGQHWHRTDYVARRMSHSSERMA
ncbi:hypothetical protein [Methylobacterium fujisawaense]|uniref:hypothetical protein n=1 Tax=Methylobacterium fujisawaense TaxID=107400 RepID=UPI0006AF4B38|nr:hypothetical protein ADL19_20790 [Streptomyces purpurogeneiscleroticus]